jgi:hypothetical protein
MVHDGVVTSTLVAAALQARAVLSGRTIDALTMRQALESTRIGIATAVAVEALLGAL